MKRILLITIVTILTLTVVWQFGRPVIREMIKSGQTITKSITTPSDDHNAVANQTGVTTWTVAMEAPGSGKDEIDGVAVDKSGNVFYGGPFEKTVEFDGKAHSAKSGTDVFLSKVSPTGETIWFTSFDSGGDDYMWDMEAAPDDDIYISGGYGGTLTINGRSYVAARDGSAYFARIDGTDGSFKWIVTAGVPGTGSALVDASRTAGGNEIKTDNAGNAVAILSGRGESYQIGDQTYQPQGVMDGFVVKISPTGEFLWSYQFAGNGRKQGRAIATTGENDIIVGHEVIGTIGSGNNTVSSKDNRTAVGAISKISSTGKLQFTKGVTSEGFSNVRGAGGDADGNLYFTGVVNGLADVAGTKVSGMANSMQYVAKLAADGTPEWVHYLGNDNANNGGEMITSASGQIAISGVNRGDDYHLFDTDGTILAHDVHTVDSRLTRSTLTVLSPNGLLVGAYEPTKTDASNGGVLEYSPDGCVIFQTNYFGTITFDNGDTYTADNSAKEKQPDRNAVLSKVCF